MRKEHAMHGRDHLPDGIDPVPLEVEATPVKWAVATAFAKNVSPSGGFYDANPFE